MSLRDLEEFAGELPYALRTQVTDYARSVRDAAPEILAEAGLETGGPLVEELMWLAALRRLHAIVGSAYWTIENANRLMEQHEAGAPMVGATDYSLESGMYRGLTAALTDLDRTTRGLDLSDLLYLPWSDAARRLADGHQRR